MPENSQPQILATTPEHGVKALTFTGRWTMDTMPKHDVATLVPTYHRLIPRIKVLVYNGDIDPCVPYNGNE